MNDTTGDLAPFPPADLPQFLRHCAGEWMSLRSQFELGEIGAGADAAAAGEGQDVPGSGDAGDEGWHSSERGELVVAFLEPVDDGAPGGLRFGRKDGGAPTQLQFDAEGGFRSGEREGRWQLGPDGSLELVIAAGDREVRERIWFTKPNLRLRSTVESRADGSPGRASFSSEIRRVSRPPSSSGSPASP